ncbi:hypothetical protein BGZ61DRAFT_370965 [Ilyonectria robusta]|uniref:uncharacterized protein n=1 Tax=Ilyonectria robusta TaxID=1079257 RepID=UPI001E8CF5E7|nr:uncharacterized protein BGZ61DRAFT_370965 [Ilyonectria robusta]KAH8658879.1 hypothetical protein BGZ61DRAFT_370965 [Ilyonectria robusta]
MPVSVSTSILDSPQQSQRLSPYDVMVIKSHEISTVNNFIAAVSNWLFLAGFIVISGAFTSISHTALLNDSQTGRVVQYALRGTPLLVLGSIFCFAGGIGMAWVYWQVKHNYSWLVDRVFLWQLSPLTYLTISLVNIYSAQNGDWSVTAIDTVCIMGSSVL